MAPQGRVGGWVPIPKKLSALSPRMAVEKVRLAWTMIGATIWGRIWSAKTLASLGPRVLAAPTYSFLLQPGPGF
jgi:hypothetical protein